MWLTVGFLVTCFGGWRRIVHTHVHLLVATMRGTRVSPKWGRNFIEFTEFSEFRESEKSLKHELGSNFYCLLC